MIYKQRSIPKKLLGLSALTKRLHPSYKNFQIIEQDLRNRKAGFSGEENFDRQLLEFKPHYPHAILNGLSLKQEGIYFQIDTLLITPAFILIIEVKNFGGKLIFKSEPETLIRENDIGEKKVMKSPVAEVKRKKIFLERWLKEKGYAIHIKGLVTLAYFNELVMEGQPDMDVIFTYQTPTYLYSLSVEKPLLNAGEISNLAMKMKHAHQSYDPFPITRKMDIPHTFILPGVFCPSCGFRGMLWNRKKWHCQKCGHRGSDCHTETLADWEKLMGNRITNREFREFTGLTDRNVALRLLTKSKLKMIGNRKAAFYIINK